jgi:hypothetical protein
MQPSRPIGCDQVVWLNEALRRYKTAVTQHSNAPGISRCAEVARLAVLLEIMEIMGVEFADDAARQNALAEFPEFVKRGL